MKKSNLKLKDVQSRADFLQYTSQFDSFDSIPDLWEESDIQLKRDGVVSIPNDQDFANLITLYTNDIHRYNSDLLPHLPHCRARESMKRVGRKVRMPVSEVKDVLDYSIIHKLIEKDMPNCFSLSDITYALHEKKLMAKVSAPSAVKYLIANGFQAFWGACKISLPKPDQDISLYDDNPIIAGCGYTQYPCAFETPIEFIHGDIPSELQSSIIPMLFVYGIELITINKKMKFWDLSHSGFNFELVIVISQASTEEIEMIYSILLK